MDLSLYVTVIRSHRRLVVIGIVVTIILVLLSVVRVTSSGLSYRVPQVWANNATLLMTQEGFPEGRSVLPVGSKGDETSFASPDRFASLVDLYAALVTSDEVVKKLVRQSLLDEADISEGELPIEATAVPSAASGQPTQLLQITGKGDSEREATRLTVGTTEAFLSTLVAKQKAAEIPVTERIEVRVVQASAKPTLVEPRSKTLPIVILLAGIAATMAAAFVRENYAAKLPSSAESEAPGHIRPVEAPEVTEPAAAEPVKRWKVQKTAERARR